jgi:hypothetical protein
MLQIFIIIEGSVGYFVEKIDGMGDDQLFMFKGNLEQIYTYFIMELQNLSNLLNDMDLLGIISISALLGWFVSWFVNVHKMRAIPLHWGGGIAFFGMILLAATPFGTAMAGSTLASSIDLLDGKVPVYRFRAANTIDVRVTIAIGNSRRWSVALFRKCCRCAGKPPLMDAGG